MVPILIQPPPNRSLLYLDYSAEEIAIAAALSGCENLKQAYQCGDPYTWMGIASKMMPENATKHSHPEIRGIFKRLTLATGYGAGAESLAQWINASVGEAENLLRFHRRTFKQFWDWQDSKSVMRY